MDFKTDLLIGACLALGACATTTQTPNNFTAERSVFGSPYTAPEVDQRGIGPGELDQDRLGGRWIDGLLYPGAGEFAYDREGNRVRLSRRDRRALRERFFANQAQFEQNRLVDEFNAQQAELPPPPAPNAPPLAQSGDTSAHQ